MSGDGLLLGAQLSGEVIPADAREQMIERAARAVYAKRPFKTSATRSPWEAGQMEAMRFEFDDAPAYYQDDCREIAAVVLSAALGAP